MTKISVRETRGFKPAIEGNLLNQLKSHELTQTRRRCASVRASLAAFTRDLNAVATYCIGLYAIDIYIHSWNTPVRAGRNSAYKQLSFVMLIMSCQCDCIAPSASGGCSGLPTLRTRTMLFLVVLSRR